jgi:hypothetical protein
VARSEGGTVIRKAPFIAAIAVVLGAGGGALLAARQSQPADRSETVGGWRIEDVAEEGADDPSARTIRMSREVDGHRISYETRLFAGSGPNWAGATFGIGTHGQNQACSHSASAAVEIGPAAERGARVRALLTEQLRGAERDCGEPAGALDMLLDGIEPAFARFTALHEERAVQLEAETATADNFAFDENEMTAPDDAATTAMDANLDGMETNMSADDIGADPSSAPEDQPKRG